MISSRIALFTSCSWWFILNVDMSTSSNGTSFRITGHLCGEFTGHRWIPRTKASDAALWCFLWSDGWVNNGEAGDLRRNRAHYDVTVMEAKYCWRRNPTESFQYCFVLLLLCNDLFINNPDVSLNVHIKIKNYYHFCHKKLIFMYCIWVWPGVEGGGGKYRPISVPFYTKYTEMFVMSALFYWVAPLVPRKHVVKLA